MLNRLFVFVLLAAATAPAVAIDPETARKIHKDATPSLVAVQYTYEGELGRRELVGAGVVVSDDGLIMTSISITPLSLPDEQMKSFKVLIPGDDQTEIDAEFLGRDERSNVRTLWARTTQESDTAPKFLYLRGAGRSGIGHAASTGGRRRREPELVSHLRLSTGRVLLL